MINPSLDTQTVINPGLHTQTVINPGLDTQTLINPGLDIQTVINLDAKCCLSVYGSAFLRMFTVQLFIMLMKTDIRWLCCTVGGASEFGVFYWTDLI